MTLRTAARLISFIQELDVPYARHGGKASFGTQIVRRNRYWRLHLWQISKTQGTFSAWQGSSSWGTLLFLVARGLFVPRSFGQ